MSALNSYNVSFGGITVLLSIVILSLISISMKHKDKPNDSTFRSLISHDEGYKSLCTKVQPHLFKDTKKAKMAIREWHRLLPRYYYVQSHRQPVNPTNEIELPYNYERINMLGPVHSLCKTPLESFGRGDEEKRVCGLKELIKLQQEQDKDYERVIYSIGSNNKWAFEEAVFANTPCKVETFDCTVAESVQPPEAIRSRVRLHKVCLSNENNDKYQKWEELHKLTGVKHPPAYLKMDIEGFEFPVMLSIIDSGKFLPLQIAMEIHMVRMEPPDFSYKGHRRVGSGEMVAFMDYMHTFGGYYMVDRRDNCLACSEILLAKLDCANHPIPEKSYPELREQTFPLLSKKLKEVLNTTYYTAIQLNN